MRWIVAGTHALDSVIRVSSYHLVHYLAGLDQDPHGEVLYLPAPVSPFHALLRRGDGRYQERAPWAGLRVAPWHGRVWQYAPSTLVPVLQRWPFNSLFSSRQSLHLTVPPLGRVLREAGFDRPDVLIIMNLQYGWLDAIVKPGRLVYRCVDDIQGFASAPRSLAVAEKELLKRCDRCIATSHNLAEKLARRGGRPVDVVRHGVDIGRYENLGGIREPPVLEPIPHPRIVYVGTLSDWFASDQVGEAAARLPSHHFVLVGPRESREFALPQASNIHYLGPRPPSEIPALLAHCDVGMIPFRRCALVESVLPVKLYEYLAAGLPVVATRWPELEQIGAPIALAERAEEFAAAIARAPEQRNRSERLQFARQNSWKKQFDRMMERMIGKPGADVLGKT